MYRKDDARSADELRSLFLQHKEAEFWFDPQFEEFYMKTYHPKSRDINVQQLQTQRIKRLFGPPPYEFLLPTDPVPAAIVSEHGRLQSMRQQNEPRVGQTNYRSLPKKATFKDDNQREYFFAGGSIAKTEDTYELYQELQRHAVNGEVSMRFKLPIAVKRRGITRPQLGEEVFLTRRARATRKSKPTRTQTIRAKVSTVSVMPKYSTGNVGIYLINVVQ